MLTNEQAQRLKLKPLNDETILLAENALSWINSNTKITVDLDDVQANVRLFVSKYIDIMGGLPVGVTSESAGGLSQSFSTANKTDLLIDQAEAIFGEENVTIGKVTFTPAKRRWR